MVIGLNAALWCDDYKPALVGIITWKRSSKPKETSFFVKSTLYKWVETCGGQGISLALTIKSLSAGECLQGTQITGTFSK